MRERKKSSVAGQANITKNSQKLPATEMQAGGIGTREKLDNPAFTRVLGVVQDRLMTVLF